MDIGVLVLEPQVGSAEAVSSNSVDEILVFAQPDFSGLEGEIALAKRILDLSDDWDGESSPAYSRHTFERAAAFVRMQNEWVWSLFGVTAVVPKIGPGPGGSIDIHWKQPSWELLVNIPAEKERMATFYGDDYGAEIIRGSLDPAEPNRGIIAWLMK